MAKESGESSQWTKRYNLKLIPELARQEFSTKVLKGDCNRIFCQRAAVAGIISFLRGEFTGSFALLDVNSLWHFAVMNTRISITKPLVF
jgi:hypothetical protein